MTHDPIASELFPWGLSKGFLRIFIPLAALLVVIMGSHYFAEYRTARITREASETLNVDLARRMIGADIAGVVADLGFLAGHIEARGLLEIPAAQHKAPIATEFKAFLRNKQLYDQARFIDKAGMETVRVNHSGGRVRAVSDSELQDKSKRYYFSESLRTGRGQIYISPLDLNVEGGQVERPLKPMIRFAMPVFDSAGQKQGVVFLNYFGQRLIRHFKRAAANIADHVELVNADGFWLSSPREEDQWGFMFHNDRTFGRRHPEAWKQILNTESGQFLNSGGLFTFTTIHPVLEARVAHNPDAGLPAADNGDPYQWKVIAHVSPAVLQSTPLVFLRRNLLLYATMLTLLAIASIFLARSQLRHRQLAAEREYERRFRRTLENVQLAAVTLDMNGKIAFCNDFLLRLTGWQHEQVYGHDWFETFIPPERRATSREQLLSPERGGAYAASHRDEILTRGGKRLVISWNRTLSLSSEGTATGITCIGEDVTDQERAERELRQLSRAVEQSPSTVMITSRDGIIEYVNPKFARLTGYMPEEVIGKNPNMLKSENTSADEYRELWETISAGGEWRGEFQNRKKNGELYWETASISAVRAADGEITHFVAVKEDITERKRLEQEVEARNQQLLRSRALAAMGQAASMIAHDLRNPLSSIKMTLQMLGRKPAGEWGGDEHELHQIALERVRYMEDILADLLTYSRPDALKPEWIAIDKLMETAISLAQKRIDEYGVEVVTHFRPGLPTLHGDSTKLRQVFSNLIINAAQATEGIARGQAQVSIHTRLELAPAGSRIQVDICDNGRGIDPGLQEQLFDPFFTTRASGTGLGLAIVKRILDQHGGDIVLRSGEMKGTCAVVTLPTGPVNELMVSDTETAPVAELGEQL